MGHKFNFSAAASTKADCKFLNKRLNKLEISAIYLDNISVTGLAVGTLCTSSDYLMAFLHWRALLLTCLENQKDGKSQRVQEDFCRILCLGQIPDEFNTLKQCLTACYHVFASLLRERLPHLPLDRKLQEYVDADVNIKLGARRPFLQKHFGDRMMGRCFCRTEGDRIGMGSDFMLAGDIVVVPLGCSTRIILRKEITRREYRFVGDIYINGYMHGRAVDDWKAGGKVWRSTSSIEGNSNDIKAEYFILREGCVREVLDPSEISRARLRNGIQWVPTISNHIKNSPTEIVEHKALWKPR
jgi:hypothetical protein